MSLRSTRRDAGWAHPEASGHHSGGPKGQTVIVAFGQQGGPPASARQTQELLALLKEAGHRDFRDARGPLGFSQRQAAGKFTREEADAYIDRLEEEAVDAPMAISASGVSDDEPLTDVSSEQLAGELRRRGWTVIEPAPPAIRGTPKAALRLLPDA